jgi:hypothetical protein
MFFQFLEADEEPGGAHHYRTISYEKALKAIQQLDRLVERLRPVLHLLRLPI